MPFSNSSTLSPVGPSTSSSLMEISVPMGAFDDQAQLRRIVGADPGVIVLIAEVDGVDGLLGKAAGSQGGPLAASEEYWSSYSWMGVPEVTVYLKPVTARVLWKSRVMTLRRWQQRRCR